MNHTTVWMYIHNFFIQILFYVLRHVSELTMEGPLDELYKKLGGAGLQASEDYEVSASMFVFSARSTGPQQQVVAYVREQFAQIVLSLLTLTLSVQPSLQ